MANTYVKIGSTVTVGVLGASSIDFTSIPATYTDLVVKASLRTNITSIYDLPQVRFNGSSSNLSMRRIFGDGSTVASNTYASNSYLLGNGATSTASVFGNLEIYVPNYLSANNKSFSADGVIENNATESEQTLVAGLWSNTAAITQVSLIPQGTSFVQYSTATLYGILKN